MAKSKVFLVAVSVSSKVTGPGASGNFSCLCPHLLEGVLGLYTHAPESGFLHGFQRLNSHHEVCINVLINRVVSTALHLLSFLPSAGKTGAILFRLHHEPENNFAIWQRQLTDVSWTPSLHATWETTSTPLAADTIEVSI